MKYNKLVIIFSIMVFAVSSLSVAPLYAKENENIKEWVSQLSDRRLRAPAKLKLIKAKDKALDSLLVVLKNEYAKSHVQNDVIEICGKSQLKEAIPYIKKYLNNRNKRLRLASVQSLSAMEDKKLADIFKEAAKDSYIHVRLAALSALIKLRDKSAVSNFSEALSDKRAEVRIKALEGLALLKDKASIDPLMERLDDKRTDIVLEAMTVLGNFKDRKIVAALITKLNSSNKLIKIKAIRTLGKIGDKSATDDIKAFLNDEYLDIRDAAQKATEDINS